MAQETGASNGVSSDNVVQSADFYMKLLRCTTVIEAGDALLNEVMAVSGADSAVILLPLSHEMEELHLALYRGQSMPDGKRLTAFTIDSRISELLSLEKAAQRGTQMHIDSTNRKMLNESFAHRFINNDVKRVSIFPMANEKLKGVVELLYLGNKSNLESENSLASLCEQGGISLYRLLCLDNAESLKRRSELIMHMVQYISNAPNRGDIVEQIIDSAKDMLKAQRVTLFRVDYIYQQLIITKSEDADGMRIPLQKNSIAAYVAKTGNALMISDAYKDKRFDPSVDKETGFTTQSVLCVPVRDSDSAVVAVIQAINRKAPCSEISVVSGNANEHIAYRRLTDADRDEDVSGFKQSIANGVWSFSSEDQTLMMTLAGHAGIALQRLDMFDQTQTQKDVKLAVLNLIKDVSAPEGTLRDLLQSIVQASYRITDAERVTLYLVDHSRQELWLAISKDIAGKRIPIGKGVAGSVAQTGEMVVIQDAYADPRFNVDIDRQTGFKTRQILCVPVSLAPSENPIAVLQVINKKNGRNFTNEDCEAIQAFSLQAAVALKRKSMDAIFLRMIQQSDGYLTNTLHQDNEVEGIWKPAKNLDARQAEARFQVSLLQLFNDETTSTKLHNAINFSLGGILKKNFTSLTPLQEQGSTDSELTTGPVRALSMSREASQYSLLDLTSENSRDAWLNSAEEEIDHSDSIFCWKTNVFQFDRMELKTMISKMFRNFNLLTRFSVPEEKLIAFVDAVESHYHPNPFHNFFHAVSVLHATFMLICQTRALYCSSFLDILSCLVAALCHDVDHPGHSQSYEINIQSPLALRHNDDAVLERHHCHTTFTILQEQKCNIFCNMSREEYRHVRKVILLAILGTDMSKHFTLIQKLSDRAAIYAESFTSEQSRSCSSSLAAFSKRGSSPGTMWTSRTPHTEPKTQRSKSVGETMHVELPFNRQVDEQRLLLLQSIVHTADLSGQAFPPDVAQIWGNAVISEFQQEAEKQRNAGFEPATFMANLETELQRCKLQSSFILNVVIPLWEQMADLLGGMDTPLQYLRHNQQMYDRKVQELSQQGVEE